MLIKRPFGVRPWTNREVAHLRSSWAQGVPMTIIANQLGRSKNSVVAYARKERLGKHPCTAKTVTITMSDEDHKRLSAVARHRDMRPAEFVYEMLMNRLGPKGSEAT